MKEIKPVPIMIAIILVLLPVAVVQWMTLPKNSPPPATELSEGTGLPEELPVLPQNELYNSAVVPSFLEDLPPFKETWEQDLLELEDPAERSKKAEL